ncbi:RidA family protein [Raineyella sp. W15-4]|uniref:RidA family protein n=1 Tax=Raineyella sp. W15-4 TaxID=3081651 RepID=UPI0029552C1B|nr:RidA family protein [Raineyella sp. W15-4]WOQ15744.1 RidA family protein [Raineyella sp. W15-4]
MNPRVISAGETVAAYSHGKVVGDLLFTSGITAHDPVTGFVRGGTIEEETAYAFELLESILATAGSSLSDLVQVQVFLDDIEQDFQGFDATYKKVVPAPYPPRATLGATLPGYRIEMLVTAYVGGQE